MDLFHPHPFFAIGWLLLTSASKVFLQRNSDLRGRSLWFGSSIRTENPDCTTNTFHDDPFCLSTFALRLDGTHDFYDTDFSTSVDRKNGKIFMVHVTPDTHVRFLPYPGRSRTVFSLYADIYNQGVLDVLGTATETLKVRHTVRPVIGGTLRVYWNK